MTSFEPDCTHDPLIDASTPLTGSSRAIIPTSLESFSPRAITARPKALRTLIKQYFDTALFSPADQPKPVLSPAGLAIHLGFASVSQMGRTIHNEDLPKESRHLLRQAFTHMEAYLTENGLAEKISVPMAKFIMSARLDVVPKTEVKSAEDNRVQIHIEGVSSMSIAPAQPTDIEKSGHAKMKTAATKKQAEAKVMPMPIIELEQGDSLI